jgi:hypothetical protein
MFFYRFIFDANHGTKNELRVTLPATCAAGLETHPILDEAH